MASARFAPPGTAAFSASVPARNGGANIGVGGADIPRHALINDIYKSVMVVQTPGSFAAFRPLPRPPPAGLFVHGVGPIAMPLVEAQARQLISQSRQAPYGKGSSTIVDTSVRNTWELDASQFEMRNPSWPAYVQSLCGQVRQDLGIEPGVKAELYKMLIYEKGAMFKAHTDTEKIPHMFGTLIISLPSPHEGGDVVVKHNGQQKVFQTSKTSQAFACWYSDTSHEVLPVLSGYRWVLTYNLAIDISDAEAVGRPCAGLPPHHVQNLRRALSRWVSGPSSSQCHVLHHILAHEYTEASISLPALKTADLARVQALKEATKDLEVDLFLGLLEKMELGSCESNLDPYDGGRRYGRYDRYGNDFCDEEDEEDDEEEEESGRHVLEDIFDSSMHIMTLVDLEGNTVAKDLPIEDEHLLDPKAFAGMDPDKEEFEGYMGNSGPTATHWYRVGAVVIVPRRSMPTFFAPALRQSSYGDYSAKVLGRVDAQLGYFTNKCQSPQAQSHYLTTFMALCGRNLHFSHEEKPLHAEMMTNALTVAVRHGLVQQFEDIAAERVRWLPTTFFHGMVELLDTGSTRQETFDKFQNGLVKAISAYPDFVTRAQVLVPLAHCSTRETVSGGKKFPKYISDWAREQLRLAVNSASYLDARDGLTMARIGAKFKDDAVLFSSHIIPKVKACHNAVDFVFGFLAELSELIEAARLPRDTSEEHLRDVAKTMIERTDFSELESEGSWGVSQAKRMHVQGGDQARSRETTRPTGVAGFFFVLKKLSSGSQELTDDFIAKLGAAIPHLEPDQMLHIWIPFLQQLAPTIASEEASLAAPQYRTLYSTMLHAFVEKAVGKEPVQNHSLVRPTVDCQCADCQSLNNFLASPTETIGRFRMAEGRRRHLHQNLDMKRVDCTHQTERTGSPHTLVVTKKFSQFRNSHKEWKSQQKHVEETLREFDQQSITAILGTEFSDIIGMRELFAGRPPRRKTATKNPPGLQQASGSGRNVRQPQTGQKRKERIGEVELVDLTRK